MHRTTLLAALLFPVLATAANCSLPTTLDQRQFTNLSDPLYAPDNPNAGGSYRYQRLAPHIAEIQMTEAYPAGPAHYTLLLTCQSNHQGRFIYTQHDGPIAPRQRQNSGHWTL